MKSNGKLILFTLILVVLATACKYFFGPDLSMSGFSPVIAIALFSGMIIRDRKLAFLLPLLALLISDAAIHLLYEQNLFDYPGFYDQQWKQYVMLLLCTLLGFVFKGRTYGSMIAAAIVAPTAFFLVSNFNVWISREVVYDQTFNGLMACYTAALPFYKNALIATVIFLPTIVLIYNLIAKKRTRVVLA